jgi:hypothetical protein
MAMPSCVVLKESVANVSSGPPVSVPKVKSTKDGTGGKGRTKKEKKSESVGV